MSFQTDQKMLPGGGRPAPGTQQPQREQPQARTQGEPAFVVKPPHPDAPPEVHEAYEKALMQAMGAAETPDAYDLGESRQGELDRQVEAWFRAAAHRAGLSPKQARIIAEAYAELEESMSGRIEQAREQAREQGRRQAMEQLRNVWGEQAPKKLETAMRGLRTLAEASGADVMRLEQALNATGLGDDPDFVRVFHHIGQSLTEDRLVDGRPAGRSQRSAAEVLYGR
jgi:hypothetical protein